MNTKAKKVPAIKPLKTKAVINMGAANPKVRFVPADTKVMKPISKKAAKTKALETYEAKTAVQEVAALPVAAPPPLKVKDINKKDVYALQGMFNDAYNGRLGMVETSAIVNGKRAFVVKVQNWSKKELNKGICQLVTVGVDSLRLATNEDQGIDINAFNGILAEAQVVVSYLEQITGLTAKYKKLTNGTLQWDIDSGKREGILVDIDVSVTDGDIDVYGTFAHSKNYNVEVEVDVCLTDATAVIAAIKKQIAEDIGPINELLVVLNKLTN